MVHAIQIILFDECTSAFMMMISPLLLLLKIYFADGTSVSHYNDMHWHEASGGPKSSTGGTITIEHEVANNAPKIG